MEKATSKDGTTIAFDRTGQGPLVVIVVGAFNDRFSGAPLAAVLARRFTVLTYDRRGRGASGDAAAYAIERELEDLRAVMGAVGAMGPVDGSAAVVGYSSGAALALEGTARGLPVTRLALYDLPPPQPARHAAELAALVAAGRRGDAVEYFQSKVVGIPEAVVAQLRHAPFRPALEAMARTLVYEATIMSGDFLSPATVGEIHQPTLAVAGSASPAFMRDVAATLVRGLPNGRSVVLEGATHDLDPARLGPVLETFLA